MKWKLNNGKLMPVLLFLCAILLLFALWAVFGSTGSKNSEKSQEELRVEKLLTSLKRVENATVYISDGEQKNAVVVFKGEDGILLRMQILEITASALGIEKSAVQVYPAS